MCPIGLICAVHTSQVAANALGWLKAALSDKSADESAVRNEYGLLMLGFYVLLCVLPCRLGTLHFLSCWSGSFGHLITLCLMLAMFNTRQTQPVREVRDAANGATLLTNLFTNPTSHSFFGNMFQEVHCCQFDWSDSTQCYLYGFLVLHYLSHTRHHGCEKNQ